MTYYFDAEGGHSPTSRSWNRGLAWDTSPPREVRRDFREDVRVSIDPSTFEQLLRAG